MGVIVDPARLRVRVDDSAAAIVVIVPLHNDAATHHLRVPSKETSFMDTDAVLYSDDAPQERRHHALRALARGRNVADDPESRTHNRRDPSLPLVRKAQAGSRRAFHELWQRYAPTVQGILLTMVDQAEAEDLTQEVAVAAFRSLASLQQPASFAAWLCTIARNLGRDALAARRRSAVAPLDDAAQLAAPDDGDPAAADEILAEVRCLPVCYREPLLLRLLLEMTGPEIAAQTGMTEGSVRVNLCRGMKLLRERLQNWEQP